MRAGRCSSALWRPLASAIPSAHFTRCARSPGPVRRGDALTIRRHLAALGELDERRHGDLYRMLGAVALEIAKRAGLEPAAAEQTRRALTRKVAATRRRPRK